MLAINSVGMAKVLISSDDIDQVRNANLRAKWQSNRNRKGSRSLRTFLESMNSKEKNVNNHNFFANEVLVHNK